MLRHKALELFLQDRPVSRTACHSYLPWSLAEGANQGFLAWSARIVPEGDDTLCRSDFILSNCPPYVGRHCSECPHDYLRVQRSC